jgi:hypothetical protein
MIEKKDFYKKTPGKCHIEIESIERSKKAMKRMDDVFKYAATNAKNSLEWDFAFDALHEEFDLPLISYGFGLESACLIQIYGLLEIRIMQTFNEEFRKVKVSRALENYLKQHAHLFEMEFFLRKFKASDMANILRRIGKLQKEDYKFIIYLEELRDGLAHKNLSKLNKFDQSKKHAHLTTLDAGTNFNSKEIFFRAIKFEWNLIPKRIKEKFVKSNKKTFEEYKKEGDAELSYKLRYTEAKYGHLSGHPLIANPSTALYKSFLINK